MNELINAIVVAVALGLAVLGLFGVRGWWAAILTAVLSYRFQQISLMTAGVLLMFFFFFELLKRLRGKSEKPTDSKVLDGECRRV